MSKKKLMDLKINLLLINNQVKKYNLTIEDFLLKYRNNYDYLLSYLYILLNLDEFILIDKSISDNIISIVNKIREKKSNDYVNNIIIDINLTNQMNENVRNDISDIQIDTFLDDLYEYINDTDLSLIEIDKIASSLVKIEEIYMKNELKRNDEIGLFRYLNNRIFNHLYDKTMSSLDNQIDKKVYKKGMLFN